MSILKKIRRLALISIVLVWIIALSGCSVMQPATPTPQPVELTFAYIGKASDYQVLADQFQKQNPNVTLKLMPLNIDPYGGRAGLTNTKADVIRWDASLISGDYLPSLLKLDDLLALSGNFPRSDMIAGSLEALQTGGVQYGIPAGIDPVVMYASPRRFAAAKVDLPSPDWNLDDLVTIASKVNNQKGQFSDPNAVVGLCTDLNSYDAFIITYLFGGNIVDRLPDPTRSTLNRPENINAVQWYASLFTQYGIAPQLVSVLGTSTRPDKMTLIQANKCALWIGSYSDLNITSWGANNENKPVMLPLPRGKAQLDVNDMDGYFISSTAKNTKIAWDWIAFLLDHPEASLAMIPVRTSQIKSEVFQKAAGKDAAVVANNLPTQIVVFRQRLVNIQFFYQTIRSYYQAIQRVINEEVNAQDALNQAQNDADKITP